MKLIAMQFQDIKNKERLNLKQTEGAHSKKKNGDGSRQHKEKTWRDNQGHIDNCLIFKHDTLPILFQSMLLDLLMTQHHVLKS